MATSAVRPNVLQQFVERARELYSLPAVAMEVLELTNKPTVDAAALKACVERDPALTGKLLRVVNSSMFGLSREVSDLNQALTLLGVKPLKLLVLGFSLPRKLSAGVEADTLTHFWRYTLLKAVAARELSAAFWQGREDEAFIAGLLQEIGILVLIQELGEPYSNFLDGVRQHGEQLSGMEMATLGFDHAILSARLLDHWNLPTEIVDAVAAEQSVDKLASRGEAESPLPQILHLAALIASIIVDGRHELMGALLEAADRYRGITVESITSLLDQMQERVTLMSNVLSLGLDEQECYRDILAAAHRQMADLAVESLPDLMSQRTGAFVEREALSDAIDRFADGASKPPRPEAREEERPVPMADAGCDDTSDPGLRGSLARAITKCRAGRSELSLVFIEVDDFQQQLILHGPDRMFRVMAAMPEVIRELCDVPCECLPVSDSRYGLVLAECERRQAVDLARWIIDRLPSRLIKCGSTDTQIECSAGVATLSMPTRNSQPDNLIEAADRCLFASRGHGRLVVKSIDVL